MSGLLKEASQQHHAPKTKMQENHYHHAVGWLTIWAAFVFASLVGFSRLSYGLLLPAIQSDLGGSFSVFGALATVNFVGYLLGTLIMPVLLKHLKNRAWLNLISLLVMNLLMIISASGTTIWQLGIWRLLIGIFSAIATIMTMTLTLERIYPRERGLASALIWAGAALGLVFSGVIAPLIIMAGANGGWRLVWIVMGLAGIVAAAGFFVAIRSSTRRVSHLQVGQEEAKKAPEQRTLWAKQRPLFQPRRLLGLTLAFFSFGAGYIIYFTFLIALLEQQGVPSLNAGFVWAAIGITGAVSAAMWGKILDRYPKGFILALPLTLGVFGALAVLTNVLAVEYGGAALVGLSAFLGPPLMITALLKWAVPDEDYAINYSTLTAVFAIGQILGPLIGGWVIERSNLQAGIATSAILFGIAALSACGYGLAQQKSQNASLNHER